MSKLLSSYILILFLAFFEPVHAQNSRDTVIATDSVITDSVESGALEATGVNDDSLNEPIPETGFLSTEPVRKVPQERVNSYRKNPDYAYANDPVYWQREAPQKPSTLLRILFSPAFRWTVLILIAGLVGYGIIQLARENNFSWLARKPKLKPAGENEPLPDEEIDFDKAILACQAEGNFRIAVRLLYLRLIHTAREKSGIRFLDSSTNAEIIYAFATHPKAAEFRWLATAYEYIYYGGYLPKPELYDELKSKFDALQQILSA